ncbi:terminase [Streptomyces reniochalinae]|uniref:Terminase n=1 Tax=Streptomyces reniochalinae TaxID=2250578 RepID=A0A367EH08_9ACTN|nr:terminase [Streptomyces reniochalinae]RCG16992.1 terminase [Streptomyces reniochalinae]
MFTREQVRFLLWFYALDENNKFVYRMGVLRRSKGWGKSPLLGAFALIEFIGPCVVDENGPGVRDPFGQWHPSGKRRNAPWVQMAAVSYQQVMNTMDPVRGMLAEGPAVADFALDPGKTLIQFQHGIGKIEPVTASSASLEGARPNFVVGDEIHHWLYSQGGQKMIQVIKRNLAKVGGRAVLTTNAHDPSEETVGRAEYEAYLARKADGGLDDVLYDCVEAPAESWAPEDPDAVRDGLRAAYGDSTWVDLDRLLAEIYDPTADAQEKRRFYMNQVVASSDAWLEPLDVDAASVPVEGPDDGGMVTLGFDGSRGHDATALVACELNTGHCWPLGIWQKPDGPEGLGWEVDREAVDTAVRSAFERWDVVGFFADLAFFEGYVDRWAEDFRETLFVKAAPGHSVAFDMRRRTKDFTAAAESTVAAFEDRSISVAADARLLTHLKNARRRPNAFGVSFGKESRESERKVDAAAALVLAREARRKAIEAGVFERRVKPGDATVYGF